MEFRLRNGWENWHVVDEDFPWDIRQIKEDIRALHPFHDMPVIFCDTCDANAILLALGEEEEEFLIPLNGYYHKEKGIIFIFRWETYEQLLLTLLHEIHHHMQFQGDGKRQFRAERHLPYGERPTEQAAREFANEKMKKYRQNRK